MTLMHFNGNVDDETGNVWTNMGAVIGTDDGKFGGAVTTSQNNYLKRAAVSDESGFGNEPFTVEGWYCPADNSEGVIFDAYSQANGTWQINSFDATPNMYIGGYGYILPIDNVQVIDTEMHHFAITRDENGDFRSFRDGVLLGTAVNYRGISLSSLNVTNIGIGSQVTANSGSYPFIGKLDDIRVTRGVCRYTDSFTPPTTEFPNQGAAVSPTPTPTRTASPTPSISMTPTISVTPTPTPSSSGGELINNLTDPYSAADGSNVETNLT
jgi:hypothetical protein